MEGGSGGLGARSASDDAVLSVGVVAVSVEDGPERASLDLGENNSTGPETDESGRYDCRTVFSNFRFEADDGESAPYRCGSWDCYCCGYRMRQNLIEEIQRVTASRPELRRLMTLTLNPDHAPDSQERQHYYITERWNALRTAISREIGEFSFIWVREEQENGLPHLHILVSRFIPQQWLSNRWGELGGGEIVDIRHIDRVEKAAHYIGKYLTKDALSGLPDGIRRYGSSQDINLDVRGNSGESEASWSLVMDDFEVVRPNGSPLVRGVSSVDFVLQRQWGGPVPPD